MNEEVMMLLDLIPIDRAIQGSIGRGDHPASDERLRQFEDYVAEILVALGLDLDIPAIKDVPQRLVRALFNTSKSFGPRAFEMLNTECRSGPTCRQVKVIEGPIQFLGLCERHSFPFFGQVYVGYIAYEQIMGICQLTRLVRFCALRATGEETIRQQIADALEALLHPYGIAIYLEAYHQCTQTRGLQATPALYSTVWRGNYGLDSALQTEFLNTCGLEH
jgi:GTP cyclohydrolase I